MTGLPNLDDIRETFSFLDDWEDRYRYVIELGQQLPALADDQKTNESLVRGCQSQVWMVTELAEDNAFRVRIDSDAFIVRGLAAILVAAVDGRAPAAVAEFDALALFEELNLLNHLSPSRGNGLRAMIDRLADQAKRVNA
ncbi:MAG: SufE family protein [Pseudomonadota bacterium]